jgi:hypothetical protein
MISKREQQILSPEISLEWLELQETDQLESWDKFILNSPRGHYCQFSTWLRSFRVYGFDFRILIAKTRDTNTIVGGIGLFSIGSRGFKIVTSPIGPILEIGYEKLATPLLDSVLQHCKQSGAILVQLQFPCSKDFRIPALLPTIDLPVGLSPRAGMMFQTGSAPNQMLLLEFPPCLPGDAWRDQMLKRFSAKTRRNIRLAEKHGVEVFEARTEADLRQGYSLIERNGKEQGYATRDWKHFGQTLLEQVRKRQAVVLVARHEGQELGVHYAMLAGRRYSHIMGGTLRTERDLKVGHFLHWRAINKARELGMSAYDFTASGTLGVFKFKMGFRPTHVQFIGPQYYVLSALRFEAFTRIYPVLRKHKQSVSYVLSAATRFLGDR